MNSKILAGKNTPPRKKSGCDAEQNQVLVGKVVKAHGIKGEIKALPFSEFPDDFKSYPKVIIGDQSTGERKAYRVIRSRSQKKFAIIELEGLANRNDSEELCGSEIWIERQYLPEPGPDEYYWHDMKGLRVVTEDGRELGTVTSLMATPGHDILVITGLDREYLIPAADDLIVDIDEEADTLIISPTPGLLEING